MHIIIVRKDLDEFQHIHPSFNETSGVFTFTDLVFPSDGRYRIFADFTPLNSQKGPDNKPLGVTIYEDVLAGNEAEYTPQSIGDEIQDKSFGEYAVKMIVTPKTIASGVEIKLSFSIQKDKVAVKDLESYLGALGHTVVLRENDLEFIHTHALDETSKNQTGVVDFAVTFSKEGRYKIFSQFQHQGKIITTDYVVYVTQNNPNTKGNNQQKIH